VASVLIAAGVVGQWVASSPANNIPDEFEPCLTPQGYAVSGPGVTDTHNTLTIRSESLPDLEFKVERNTLNWVVDLEPSNKAAIDKLSDTNCAKYEPTTLT
jgi:hypothetical protein